jgi:hypothetical protein
MIRILLIHRFNPHEPCLQNGVVYMQLRTERVVLKQGPSQCLKRLALGDLIKKEYVEVPRCAVGHCLHYVMCFFWRDLCMHASMYVCMYVCLC